MSEAEWPTLGPLKLVKVGNLTASHLIAVYPLTRYRAPGDHVPKPA